MIYLNIQSAEIISVGTELLLGDIVNTDAAFISKRLAEIGIPLYYQTVVGDNEERLSAVLKRSLERCDLVIMTGGLGPTCDDITKNTAAAVFGLPVEEDADVRRSIEDYFIDIKREMTLNNIQQAKVPRGAVVLKNYWGTAPGLIISGKTPFDNRDKVVILLPGPPKELEPMFMDSVMPYLEELSGDTIYSLNLHMYGIGESGAENVLRDMMEEANNPTIAPYACESEVRIRITARGDSREKCEAMCRKTADKIYQSDAGRYIYTESTSDQSYDDAMVNRLIDVLRKNNLTIGTAESCTAGMIASRIADIPGSSDVLVGGVVSYSNDVKKEVLGVSDKTLAEFGAVSCECAGEMAAGARRVLGCSIAVAVTGIAGPGGGTAEKPVGTVCFGISDKNGTECEKIEVGSQGDRGKIRRMTVAAAFMKVIRRIEKFN